MLSHFQKEDTIFIVFLLLIFIVFNINLGLMPVLADEPIRALVSLEMVLSGDYVFPTIAGEPYLNKPPLFNWIVGFLIKHTKNFSEWHLRIISTGSFFILSILHFIVCSKHVNKQIALWSSLAFLTCGRILFYDSMMGYIDPVFSLIVVANFYLILIQSRKESYFYLFAGSYILCTIGFFLKGFPACTFQFFTLLSVFIYRKKFRALISCAHAAGICIFILLLSIYYYEYSERMSLETVFNTLLHQSTQRTPASVGFNETLIHIASFPFQFIADFLPFSLLLLLFFRRNSIFLLKENDFVFVSFIIIGCNIVLYWLSAETRARYLFMFLPLFFTVTFYLFQKIYSDKVETSISKIVLVLQLVSGVTILILPFLNRFSFIEYSVLKTGIPLAGICILLYVTITKKLNSIFSLFILLVILRISFNLYILPLRAKEATESVNKQIGATIAALTKSKPLYLLAYPPINDDILYYITLNKKQIIHQKKRPPVAGNYYICNRYALKKRYHLTILYSFQVSYDNTTLYLVKK
ncbi:ArnT family glycosyltransferase [Cytophaga hutchinsonii]|uniref:4-amino-4-deoxy-L-arabinose transferase (Lipid A modification) n=1 Tax=Cytophaga hutchinsonii (strain ATCC 33406 / DSM 1761 / CIP 103989 / NBRC 15051 / NCIMB 9469 / D465) TaxID=269798 RepID=A0A6N4SWM1_CYTH3|nr:4-amino-4-deoxy-L-arabinose transferase [Cytophaga hutchinsonii]ABG61005.1 4-amino-4-deoxy-L-arabinose transferase (lipid A modification) [Cytophaga hutchinsonii ATCC 33406]SFX44188.1 4-amino-4-deoxy-L-arabinose transferase [Cytophaga hutchinsonii ATCC 33406]